METKSQNWEALKSSGPTLCKAELTIQMTSLLSALLAQCHSNLSIHHGQLESLLKTEFPGPQTLRLCFNRSDAGAWDCVYLTSTWRCQCCGPTHFLLPLSRIPLLHSSTGPGWRRKFTVGESHLGLAHSSWCSWQPESHVPKHPDPWRRDPWWWLSWMVVVREGVKGRWVQPGAGPKDKEVTVLISLTGLSFVFCFLLHCKIEKF